MRATVQTTNNSNLVYIFVLVNGELLQGGTAWEGWRINTRTGELIDPHGQPHTPHGIRAWHWTWQELRRLRGEENQAENVQRIKTGREGHALTLELHRRLNEKKD